MNTEWVQLKAEDGKELSAYVVRPEGEPRAALVIVQEIFGVNQQIQKAAEEWASHGFLCIAPAMFDRLQKDVKLEYNQADFETGYGLMQQFSEGLMDQTKDVKAAVDWLRSETDKPVGVVGYCFGGTMAWLSATRLKVEAAAGYYGGSIANFLNEEPQCPVILHFGADDAYISTETRDTIQTAHPEVPMFVYENAGHAFARSVDPTHYSAEAATLANKRTLLFLEQHFSL